MTGFWKRLRATLGGKRLDAEMDADIRSHLEMATEESIRRGMTREEAERAARRSFGGIERVREELRQTRGIFWIDTLRRDLRQAMRILGKNPGSTAAAVLTLGLGIGATTAVFSIADPLLTRPLPVRDPGDLVILRTADPRQPDGRDRVPQELYDQLLEGSETLSSVFGSHGFEPLVRVATVGGAPPADAGERMLIEPVTGTYFPALGVEAAAGRLLSEADDQATAPPVAVISHDLWQRRFAKDGGAIGTTIRLENPERPDGSPMFILPGRSWAPLRSATIVGVAPPSFYGTNVDQAPDLWISFAASDEIDTGGTDGLRVMGRRREDMSLAQVQAEIDVLASQLVQGTFALDRIGRVSVRVEPGSGGFSDLRLEFARPLFAMGVAVGIVLLVACANVAGLMLARGASRRQDMAVRLALGSGRLGIVRPLLAEGAVLALLGGLCGLVVAWWGSRGIASFLPPDSGFAPRLGLDERTLGFAAVVSVASVLLFSVLPAFSVSRLDPNAALAGAGRTAERSASRFGTSRAVVTGQIAFTLLLLVGTGLFVRTLQNLREAGTGFDLRNVLEFEIEAPIAGGRIRQFADTGLAALRALPDVVSATVYGSDGLLGETPDRSDIRVGGALATGAQPVVTPRVEAGFGFFETLGIPIVSGQAFGEQGAGIGAGSDAVIVSESLARALFGDESAVGRRVHTNILGNPRDREVEIVGVAGDAKHISIREENPWTLYLPYGVSAPTLTRFALRTRGDASALGPAVRRTIEEFDESFRVASLQTLWEVREASIRRERFLARLVGVFGLVALVLASTGIYGAMSYTVSQRTGEIGIRMALGATIRDVSRMLMRETATMVALGILVGLALALAATRAVSGLLFGVTPMDTTSIALAILVLAGSSAAAAWLPARRASRLDPLRALRHE